MFRTLWQTCLFKFGNKIIELKKDMVKNKKEETKSNFIMSDSDLFLVIVKNRVPRSESFFSTLSY